MFHHRASEIPGLASADSTTSFVAAQQNENIHVRGSGVGGNGTSGGTGKGVSFQTPSNVKKSLTTGGTKTSNNNGGGGTTTIRRRALGDISNKKSNVAQQSSSFVSSSQQRKVGGQNALKSKSGLSSRTNGTTLIPTLSSKKPSSSSSTSIIPASSLSVKKSTVPSNLGQQFRKLQIHQESQHTTVKSSSSSPSSSLNNFRSSSSKLAVVRPKQTTSSSSSSTLIRPQGTRGGKMDNTSKAESSNVEDLLETGPVPDIEYPAGRTWKQQLEFDLKDEDDVASTSTLDHLLRDDDDSDEDDEEKTGRRTMWHDWSESVWQNRQKKEQEREERKEKEVQDQINRLLEEEKLGLESLYDDTMDGFDNINNGHSHSYIFKGDMESNLLSIDDDDWSLPASSECGQFDQTNDEDLLFEL